MDSLYMMLGKDSQDGYMKHKKTKGDSERQYLQHRLSRTGRSGEITEHIKHRGCYVIKPQLTKNPLVSIVIPTAGNTWHIKGKPVDLVSNLVTQIFTRSTYTNKEVIIKTEKSW